MYIKNERPINRCQYWVVKEPETCTFWDKTGTVCTFQAEVIISGVSVLQRSDFYPYCNYIGTNIKCKQYAVTTSSDPDIPSVAERPRCVLPDPYRHLYSSPNCSKWVVSSPPTSSGTLVPLDYSKINGYNSGNCDYTSSSTGGTQVTCSGFSPQHLAFVGAPIQERCTLSGVAASDFLSTSIKLPFNYEVLNKRSELGRCNRWSKEEYLFTISGSEDIGKLNIVAPIFSCSDTTGLATTFSGFYLDTANSYVRPPCNGSMPDCPRYTGNLASTGYLPYLSSIFLRSGDKVMAEQILEIRYNLRKENWDPTRYKDIFGKDADIYAHTGVAPTIIRDDATQTIRDYSLPATQVKINNFDCFDLTRKQVLLTQGTPSDDNKISFDTLIQEIKNLPLEPIIRSVFDTMYATNQTLSYSQKRQYIFETSKQAHTNILIMGDYFYKNNIFAINMSDPSISFPFNDMFAFGSMFAYREFLGKSLFEERILLLSYYILALIDIAPDKVYNNTSTDDDYCFMINVHTFFGENKIMVFDSSNMTYTFDTITINKHFCGGLVAQTKFSTVSQEMTIGFNENYELYTCYPRYQPTISYTFQPLNTSTGSYTIPYSTYLDTVVYVPPANPLFGAEVTTIYFGYKLYKIKVMPRFFVTTCDTTSYSKLLFLGNAGKVLVVIDDGFKLHGVIRKWDSGEVDANKNPKPMILFLKGMDANGEERSIEMEIIDYCSDAMEINQLLLKPKRFTEYVRLYSPFIEFTNGLYIYERFSFGNKPVGTEGTDYAEVKDYPETAVIVSDMCTLKGEPTSGSYILETIPTFPIVAAIVFRGMLTGRVRGQVKSDLLVWVKQPFCSDVEIKYNWEANYQRYIIQPTGRCFVSDIGRTYLDTCKSSYSPGCGDHGFGRISRRPAPMWYPYKACDEYAKYNISAGSGENDQAPMEFWLDAIGRPIIGKTPYNESNLRMLGPARSYGYTTDTHASIWACNCDYTHENLSMLSSPWFSGWAKVRSGVEGETLYYMIQNGGIGPKFGNKKRPYLLSYRSIACLNFYKINDVGDLVRDKKWLPAYEAFTDIVLNDSFKTYPWKHYFNESDNIMTYVNQLGICLVNNSIDKISVNEELVYVEAADPSLPKVLARYRFTDIFEPHYTTTGMLYPEPRRAYTIGQLSPKQVTSWLTYKDYTGYPFDGSKSIQWAWREFWKPLVRELPDIRDKLRSISLTNFDIADFHKLYLSFINVLYLNYTYNFYIGEFRRVPTEGFHTISWVPSTYDKEHPLPTHFIVRLDNGPLRLLDSMCEVITDKTKISQFLVFPDLDRETLLKHIDFYDVCSKDPWLNTVGSFEDLEAMLGELAGGVGFNLATSFILYDAETKVVTTEDEAKENARKDKRVVQVIRDDVIAEVFFNRGLMLNIKSDMLRYLPKREKVVDIKYDFKLSRPTHNTGILSTIDPLAFYPMEQMRSFNLYYTSIDSGSANLLIKFESRLVVSKIEITYKLGIKIPQEGPLGVPQNTEEPFYRDFRNIPKTTLMVSQNGLSFAYQIEGDYEFSSDYTDTFVTKTYAFNIDDLEYMSTLVAYLSIDFMYKPRLEEFNTCNFEDSSYFTYLMDAQSIKIYTVEYTSLNEQVQLFERKFNISIGGYGTYPIHGTTTVSGAGSLLYPNPYELSTTYQYDTDMGMAGMPNSMGSFTSCGKVQNRVALDIGVDGEVLEGTYTDFELKQKLLYDTIALSGEESIQLVSAFDKVFKETLLSVKVNVLPKWDLKLENKLMIPLTPVKPEKQYYPEGHEWTWDRSSFKEFFNCGSAVRQWRTIFDYKWGRVSGLYGYNYETDIFDLYSYGLTRVLTNWVNGQDGRSTD